MKASAVLLAFLFAAATTPSLAFGHFWGPRPGGPPPHGPGGHHGHHGLGFLDGALGPAVLPPLPGPDAAEPVGYPAPAPYCLPAPPPHINPGPHIIYIGHRPAISGPKVIYGTG
jgi:hypothetical protein